MALWALKPTHKWGGGDTLQMTCALEQRVGIVRYPLTSVKGIPCMMFFGANSHGWDTRRLFVRDGFSGPWDDGFRKGELSMNQKFAENQQGLGLMSLFGDLFHITFKYLLEMNPQ